MSVRPCPLPGPGPHLLHRWQQWHTEATSERSRLPRESPSRTHRPRTGSPRACGRSTAQRYRGQPPARRPRPPPPPDSPEDDGVPHHDVVLGGGPAHPGRGILLQPAGHTERSGDSPAGRSCALGVTQAGGRAPLRKQRNPQAAGAERRYAISGARPTPPPCCAAPLLPR